MARTYVRSFRLEEELGHELEKLPQGTANTLVNELVAYYFAHPELQKVIAIKDQRFPGEQAVTLDHVTDPKAELGPELTQAAEKVLGDEVPADKAAADSNIPDDSLPGF